MGKSCSKLKLKQKYNPQGKHYHRFNVFPSEITKVFQGLMCLLLNSCSPCLAEGTCVFYILVRGGGLEQVLKLQEPLCFASSELELLVLLGNLF